MNFFEKILEEKSKLENSYDYFTQWEYDKKLYQDILLGVREYYSNYTDHGSNHSETILTNILRMFGEDELKNLSSFDIWLLLEAAYLHDCGMYISREEAQKTLQDKNFIEYLKKVCETPSHPMNKFTKPFKIKENQIFYEDSKYNIDIEYNMRFLISSYKRVSHAQDFKNVVFYKEKLLPERIYHVLSTISKAHGESFQDVMRLPKKESGTGKEMGHPIFIACLLRMGDLLDIDNSRISPTVVKNIIEIIPDDSKLHLEKHRAISHLWIDKEKIEIVADVNCGEKSYEVAEITGKWFDYIREEYNNQLYNWKLIIPYNFKGILPRLGELKINIQDYEYINSKYKPKFSVDTNNILELLVGSSIYERVETALREIIQNSMDATYLRVFEERKEEILKKEEFSISEIKDLFKDKEIKVNIEKNKKKSDENSKYNYWNISIEDKGIGIDKEKLKYLIEAGSSYKDKSKIIQINDMPNWLKPSGNFGIGFQSIFLLTNKVRLQSKSLYTNENIDVDLIKPSIKEAESGNIYFRKTKFNYKQEIGTKISFEYRTLKVASSYYYSGEKAISYIDNFDPLMDKEFDIKIYHAIDEINSINKYSFIKIELLKDRNEIELVSENQNFVDEKIKKKDNYQICFIESNENIFKGKVKCFYKNQPINKNKFEIKYFSGVINIFGYNAKKVLLLNRNEIRNEFLLEKEEEVLKSIYLKLEEKYLRKLKEVIIPNLIKEQICYFYFYHEKTLKWLFKDNSNLVSEYSDELKKFYYEINFSGIFKINELKKEKEIIIKVRKNSYSYDYILSDTEIQKDFLDLIVMELFKINKYEFKWSEHEKEIKIKLKKIDSQYNIIKNEYQLKNLNSLNFFSRRKRVYIYCNERTLKLRLRKELSEKEIFGWIGYLDLFNRKDLELYDLILENNFILFPFYLKDENTMIWNTEMEKNYIEFCYKNRAEEKLSKEEFTEALRKFVKYLKIKFKSLKINITEK